VDDRVRFREQPSENSTKPYGSPLLEIGENAGSLR